MLNESSRSMGRVSNEARAVKAANGAPVERLYLRVQQGSAVEANLIK